jgi:hypothetical protein
MSFRVNNSLQIILILKLPVIPGSFLIVWALPSFAVFLQTRKIIEPGLPEYERI